MAAVGTLRPQHLTRLGSEPNDLTTSQARAAKPSTSNESSQTPAKRHSAAWTALNQEVSAGGQTQNEAWSFWWQSTAVTLAILLEKAGYSYDDQVRDLRLYSSAVIPELGVGPDHDDSPQHWKSFMTDHHCPVEFSWEWGSGSGLPLVRFSFEPIGPHAGTAEDPFNRHATLHFVDKYHTRLEGCDLSWFRHMWGRLVHFDDIQGDPKRTPGATAHALSCSAPGPTHGSRSFLALEFNKTDLVMKAYYVPEFKARADAVPTISIINEAIESLPRLSPQLQTSHRNLLSFLKTSQGQTLGPEMVAIDCVAPEKSRIKIYMRSRTTTLDSVLQTLCLGDESERERLGKSLEEFQKLWKLVFGLDLDSTGELPDVSHRTGGILYYFSMESESAKPSVKVYLPIRHYAKGDLAAATGLQTYLRSTSRSDCTHKYIEAITDIM